MELLERVAQDREVRAFDGVDTREDERLGWLVARQRSAGGPLRGRQRVTDLAITH